MWRGEEGVAGRRKVEYKGKYECKYEYKYVYESSTNASTSRVQVRIPSTHLNANPTGLLFKFEGSHGTEARAHRLLPISERCAFRLQLKQRWPWCPHQSKPKASHARSAKRGRKRRSALLTNKLTATALLFIVASIAMQC